MFQALDNTFIRLREGLDEVLRSLLAEEVLHNDNDATKAAKILFQGCMNEGILRMSLFRESGNISDNILYYSRNFNVVI